MRTTLDICLFLATHLHAGSIISSNSATSASSSTISADTNVTPFSSLFVVDNELAKISASCLSSRDYELLAGNVVKHGIVRLFVSTLVSESVMSIGLTELRAALNFAPLCPWEPYNSTESSESELASAPTIEAYYDLREPRSKMSSLDSLYLLEQNLSPAIAYLDKRFPSIRIIFRRTFEEMHRSDAATINRKAIDRWIEELLAIYDKINKATSQMRRNDDKCWDLVE